MTLDSKCIYSEVIYSSDIPLEHVRVLQSTYISISSKSMLLIANAIEEFRLNDGLQEVPLLLSSVSSQFAKQEKNCHQGDYQRKLKKKEDLQALQMT